jgi:flagellin FlaB
MMQNKLTDNRGQVGIGTLIVFIALVLVAAIAAGVLINTAGFLQTQAEQTGQDSTDQVADNINVIGEVGQVAEFGAGAPGDDISTVESANFVREIRLTVQRSPGSSEIDLSGLSIQYVGDNGFAQLVYVDDASNPDVGSNTISNSEPSAVSAVNTRGSAGYLIQSITADTPGDPVITEDGDRYEIVIPLATAKDNGNTVIADADVLGGNLAQIGAPVSSGGTDNPSSISFNDVDVATPQFDNLDLGLLQEGQQAELEVTTDSGATRNVVVAGPDTLIGDAGNTVSL